MDDDEFSGNIFDWDVSKIIKYISVHYVQFILLILTFVIIYVVDRISNINATLFSMPSAIPGIPPQLNKIVKIKKNKKK